MIRKAFLIHAKPGLAAEYEKRHNPIWPELEKVLKSHGISNYSIFLHEESNALFCYLEHAVKKRAGYGCHAFRQRTFFISLYSKNR